MVLITTVVVTYSTIRNSPVQQQPQIQSAVDETNLAIKEILGFTVGYYGSVLKTTGNTTFARELAIKYLQSGLIYVASMHPEWGASFNLTNSQLCTQWYAGTSYSDGNLTVSYNLTGLGISGITYQTSCSLTVQVMPTMNNQAYLTIVKDGNEPLVNLGKNNFNFYSYDTKASAWNLVNPLNEPLAYSNGTYEIDIPFGLVDVNSYLVQVEDQRGVIVVASSYTFYTCNLTWYSTAAQQSIDHYVDLNSSSNQGTHSDFTAMQHGPDGMMDTLTENITKPAVPESWVSPFTGDNGGEWVNLANAYDSNTSTYASDSVGRNQWTAYLTLQGSSSGISCHMIRYFIGRTSVNVNRVQIDVYSNTRWINVYDGGGVWNQWTNLSLGSEMSVSKMRFRFQSLSSGQSAYVYEAQFLQSTTPQNCQLSLEVQWVNVNYTNKNQWLCIYGGPMPSENIQVDVKNGAVWNTLFSDLIGGWNNVSVSQYMTSSNFTIRFIDGTPAGDSVQSSWQIDTALLHYGQLGSSNVSGTIVVELLQNGTMRWVGQNLQLSTREKPIPPIPVKSIHVNQTLAGVDSEVPFQIEDWASDYRIPLGMTANASVFNSGTMLVFLANSNVSKVTIWWNGSDTAAQTPYAYTNRYFLNDDVSNGILNNTMLGLRINTGGNFQITSTQGTSTATATFMRINGQNSVYGSLPTFTIHHGVIRDIVTQEAEWSNGAPNCPNLYAYIVLTLPANVPYYTYQLRVIFLDSNQARSITDLCALRLTVSTGSPQTENGTSAAYPIVSTATGLFYNQAPTAWAHHWSQFISGTRGAGIMFTDDANQKLYFFDSPGKPTGAISVSNSMGNVIELRPVTMNTISNYQNQADVAWYGAIVTFDGTMPIYQNSGGAITGLWMTVEYIPVVTVTTGN